MVHLVAGLNSCRRQALAEGYFVRPSWYCANHRNAALQKTVASCPPDETGTLDLSLNV
jgi:hypothetical protein